MIIGNIFHCTDHIVVWITYINWQWNEWNIVSSLRWLSTNSVHLIRFSSIVFWLSVGGIFYIICNITNKIANSRWFGLNRNNDFISEVDLILLLASVYCTSNYLERINLFDSCLLEWITFIINWWYFVCLYQFFDSVYDMDRISIILFFQSSASIEMAKYELMCTWPRNSNKMMGISPKKNLVEFIPRRTLWRPNVLKYVEVFDTSIGTTIENKLGQIESVI